MIPLRMSLSGGTFRRRWRSVLTTSWICDDENDDDDGDVAATSLQRGGRGCAVDFTAFI